MQEVGRDGRKMKREREKNMGKIEIFIPGHSAGERISDDLRALTKLLHEKGLADGSIDGMGGKWSYGADFENGVFLLHRFCWCYMLNCPWCFMNSPEENPEYEKGKVLLLERFGKYWHDFGGAPNFFHKKSKSGIRWYKWIGRDNDCDLHKAWTDIFRDCLESLSGKGGGK